MVVLSLWSLTFVNNNVHLCLLVLGCHILFGLLSGDHRSSRDDNTHLTSNRLNSERQRGHINKEQILGLLSGLATQDTSLYSSTISHSLIWVDSFVRFFTIEVVFKK